VKIKLTRTYGDGQVSVLHDDTMVVGDRDMAMTVADILADELEGDDVTSITGEVVYTITVSP